jgi:hypothetical protein
MAEKSWTFDLVERVPPGEGGYSPFSPRRETHTVDLHHSYWTTRRTIRLDGVVLPPDQIRSYGIFGVQSDDLFMVDGHACVVHIRTKGISYTYDFLVDGVSVQSGQPVEVPPEVFRAEPGGRDAMPRWAWLFIVLCVVVGFGSIFAGLGLAYLLTGEPPSRNARFVNFFVAPVIIQAVYSIITTSKEPRTDTGTRMRRCAVILVRTGLIVTGIVAAAFTFIR